MIFLRIVSGEKIEKINLFEDISSGLKAVLSTPLYFTQLRMFEANVK